MNNINESMLVKRFRVKVGTINSMFKCSLQGPLFLFIYLRGLENLCCDDPFQTYSVHL